MKLEKIRDNVSIEPRWSTTTGGLECRYLLRDATTNWYAWITPAEAAVAMALRYIKDPNEDRIRRYALHRHGLELSPASIKAIIDSFDRYAFLENEASTEDIDTRQRAERKRVYDDVQVNALRSVVNWAAEESPYYSTAIRNYANGAVPEISTLSDIKKLPRLSKPTFRKEMANLHSRALAENRDAFPTSWATSSGTSGNRVQTLTDPNRQKRFVSDCTWQFIADSLPTDKLTKCCVLTTPVCSGTECHMDINRPLSERLISDGRRLILNSFISPAVATNAALGEIVSDIQQFQPNVMRGAASYIAAVAHYVVRNGIKLPRFDYVVLGWELNSRIHVRLLEKVFGCRVIDEWGATEMMPISSQCPHGNYHVADEHYIEIVRNGEPVGPGEVGQILVTSLRQHATPLIRYEIGDLARASTVERCPCGNPAQIFASTEGRARDVILSVSGEPITAREIDNIVSGDVPRDGVDYYSLVQINPGTYRFMYVASDNCPPTMETDLHRDLLEALGASADIAMVRTKEIYPSNSGKFRLCYQENPSSEYQW